MWRIALRTLRFRKTAFLASFLALFAGAALVTACGTLMETGLRRAVAPQALAAAPIVVAGDQGNASETVSEWARVNAGAAATVDAVPGVAKTVGYVSFSATLLRGGHPVGTGSLGHAWTSAQLAPYTVRSGAAPDAAGQVVVDANLARQSGVETGDRVEIAAHGTTERFTVAGIAASAGPALDHPSIYFSAPDTARLAPHPGQPDAIAVFPSAGVDVDELGRRVAAAVEGRHAVVLTGDQRGLAEFPEAGTGAQRLQILAGVFAGWTLLATLFGVSSMIALSIQQRQREIALLRAIGAEPRQVRRMIVAETLVLSVVATALAAIPGEYAGKLLFDQFTAHGAASPLLGFERGWLPAAIGAIATLGAALGAAAFSGKRAARTRPVNALAEVSIEGRWLNRPRLIFAILFLSLGLTLAIVTIAAVRGPFTISVAGPASIFFAIGLALLAPGITKVMVKALGAPIRRTGVMGDLAVLNARARTQRLAAAVTPVILLTGIATGVLYLQTTEDSANQRLYRDNLNADIVVGSSTGGFAPGVVDRVRTVPGVTAASEFVTATGQLAQPEDTSQVGGWKLQGVDAQNAKQTASADAVQGDLAALHGDTAAIPAETARQHGIGVGATIRLTLGDNSSLSLRVVALIAATGESARILVPAGVVAPHTTAGLPAQILVRAAPGTDIGTLTAAIMRAGNVPGLWAAGRDALIAGQSSLEQMLRAGNYAVVILVIGYAALSVVNTMVAAAGHRRREFGLQRLAGSTRRQVLRMMSIEGLMAALVGIVLGSIASVVTLVPFSLAKNDSPIPSGPLWMYFAVLGFVAAVTLSSTLVTTWRSTRIRPIEVVAE